MPIAQVMRPLVALCVGLAVLIGATTLAQSDSRGAVKQTDASPLDGDGMWIWYVSRAGGGSVQRIAATAKRRGIETVFIKSSDGGRYWGQFSRRLVRKLKRRGLNVCAWQYVYGGRPTTEAAVGARAVRAGADCLVIDAESQYEGKYTSARKYVRSLRARIGADYPLGLAGFPYVHYHPAFPYSVFLGPGGAQFNLPQMYWRAIGTTVSRVYSTTYLYNRVYGRPIHPLGQVAHASAVLLEERQHEAELSHSQAAAVPKPEAHWLAQGEQIHIGAYRPVEQVVVNVHARSTPSRGCPRV